MAESVFEAVKQSITVREAAQMYGIEVNRSDMACCPFHDDKNPSMKLNEEYFYCFGCGATGDVIDFTARLYNLSPKEAAEKLAQDFGLAYDSQAPPRRRYVKQKSEAQKFKEDRDHAFRVLVDYFHLLQKWETDYSPKTPEENPHPRFMEAIQKKDYVGYLLDFFLEDSPEEQKLWIAEHQSEIAKLERRVKFMADKPTNRERLQEITADIEQGIMELFESEKYMRYLSVMSKFHRYSVNNTMLIYIYGYECKRHHDTPRIRLQNEQGNPTPICEIKPVGQSKLELMASKIFERVWGDQREIVLQTCKMLDACYKPDADRRADLMKAKDDSIQLLQQQLDDLVVVRARGEIEQDKFLQRTIEIQQQMEALRQSKAQIASEDYNPGRLDMEAIEAALCEAVEMHDGLVSEDFIDLFVSQVTPLSDSRFAWCLDFSPQPTVAFLNLAGQRKYTTCSMDSKLHFGPFADEEGHTIPFPGSLRR